MRSFVAPYYRKIISFLQSIVVFAEPRPLRVFATRMPTEPGDEEPIHAPRVGAWSRQGALRIFHALHLNQLLAGYNMEVY